MGQVRRAPTPDEGKAPPSEDSRGPQLRADPVATIGGAVERKRRIKSRRPQTITPSANGLIKPDLRHIGGP